MFVYVQIAILTGNLGYYNKLFMFRQEHPVGRKQVYA